MHAAPGALADAKVDGPGRHFGVIAAGASASAIVLAAILAPPAGRDPGLELGLPLLFAASMHVAATPWLATLGEVRACATTRRIRFVLAPLLALCACIAIAGALSTRALEWCLLGFFAWQFVHFAKQNVGVVGLACGADRLAGPTTAERRWIVASGVTGVAGLLARPSLVEVRVSPSPVVFHLAALAFCVCAVGGLLELRRRSRSARSAGFTASYVVAVCFSCPIFFTSSPYAAVAGMTIAHGLQYLGILGLVAAGPIARRRRGVRVALLVNVAFFGGLAIHAASRLSDPIPGGHLAFGAYLGVYVAHFVVDAGLWRMSLPSSRRFVAAALPRLITPRATVAAVPPVLDELVHVPAGLLRRAIDRATT